MRLFAIARGEPGLFNSRRSVSPLFTPRLDERPRASVNPKTGGVLEITASRFSSWRAARLMDAAFSPTEPSSCHVFSSSFIFPTSFNLEQHRCSPGCWYFSAQRTTSNPFLSHFSFVSSSSFFLFSSGYAFSTLVERDLNGKWSRINSISNNEDETCWRIFMRRMTISFGDKIICQQQMHGDVG